MKKKRRKATSVATPNEKNAPKFQWLSIWKSAWIVLFISALYVFFLLVIRLEQIHFAQMPVFFAERRFFLAQLRVPGGFIDCLAAFLTDLYQIGWLGALILTGLILLAFLLFKAVMRPGRFWGIEFLPVLLLVFLQTRFDYSIAKTLSLILALEGFLMVRDAFPAKTRFRFPAIIFLFFMIYLMSPAAMLLCVLLCSLHEIANPSESNVRRILLPVGYVFAGGLIPRLAADCLFLVPLKSAYFHHAFFLQSGKIQIVGAVLDGLILASTVFFFLRKNDQKTKSATLNLVQGGVGLALFGLVLFCAFFFGKAERQVVRVRYDAHEGRWRDLAKQVNNVTLDHPLNLFHFNRGLYHTGKMASDLFSLPQWFGRYGLFPHKDLAYQYPLDISDFYFELGHVNEAERWASEAQTLYGETPAVLKRLALVNLLQDEPAAAMKFLARLKQNPLSRGWAEHYRVCLNDPIRMAAEKQLVQLHACMPPKDFIVVAEHPEIDLGRMLEQSPGNRMAFEYVVADRLISRDLDGFVNVLKRYPQFLKAPLPRCYEEALIAYLTLKGQNADRAAAEIEIRQSGFERFKKFESVLGKYHANSDAAYNELSQWYANTYWYYMLYSTPAS